MEHGKDGSRKDHDERTISTSHDTGDAPIAKTADDMRSPWSPSTEANAPTPSIAHKRTISGGFLSRFSFLRPAEPASDAWLQQGNAPRSKTSIDDEEGSGLPREDTERQPVIKQRKRKGSLRKSALLGVKRLGSDGREKRNSMLQREVVQDTHSDAKHAPEEAAGSDINEGVQIKVLGLARPSTTARSISPSSTGVTEASLSMLSELQGDTPKQDAASSKVDDLATAPDTKLQPGYNSTTEDDDDVLSFTRPAKPTVSTPATPPPSDEAATSYFTAQLPRIRSARRLRPSPLQHAYAPAPEPYSYTETEYWGWVILFVTWLLFTVGMGSCLDIWSWAWDVGETPYAPPELEDDPTLPIVGYYPALIVLTGVVAWVWITVAWVGMKYFRHAKIEDIR